MAATATGAAEPHEKTSKHQIVVVDLDKAQSPQQVKQLGKGQGKLMIHVEHIVNDLIEAGTSRRPHSPW
jgi:hypothetical protein